MLINTLSALLYIRYWMIHVFEGTVTSSRKKIYRTYYRYLYFQIEASVANDESTGSTSSKFNLQFSS